METKKDDIARQFDKFVYDELRKIRDVSRIQRLIEGFRTPITNEERDKIQKYKLVSNKDLQDALSSLSDDKTVEITDKKVASDVKKIKKMTENIQEPIAEEIKNDIVEAKPVDQMGDNPFALMEQMMQSSDIGKIAQQVSESINLEEMLGGGNSGGGIANDNTQSSKNNEEMSQISNDMDDDIPF